MVVKMVLTWKHKFNKKYGFPKEESHSKAEISRLTGVTRKILDEVFDRGVGAFKTNPESVRPNVKSPERWGFGRVYSFVMGGKTQKTADKDLWERHLKNVQRRKNKTK